MLKIPCFIVDDEEPAVEVLSFFIHKYENLELIGTAYSVSDIPQEYITDTTLFFLDIQMPKQTGIEFIEQHQHKLQVILTTSHEQYALKAFNLSVIDYLLKPFSQKRFEEALEKATSKFKLKHLEQAQIQKPFIEVKYDYKTLKLYEEDIYYIEGLKQYLKVHTKEKPFIILDSFKNMEQKLSTQFIRIHKSFMVNKQHISRYSKTEITVLNKTLPVSKKDFLDDLVKP